MVDIGQAGDTLKAVLGGLNFQNLDEEPAFAGRNTTTEFLARVIFDRMLEAIARGELGPDGRRHRDRARDAARVARRVGVVRGSRLRR